MVLLKQWVFHFIDKNIFRNIYKTGASPNGQKDVTIFNYSQLLLTFKPLQEKDEVTDQGGL